jgi:hypothetical protein
MARKRVRSRRPRSLLYLAPCAPLRASGWTMGDGRYTTDKKVWIAQNEEIARAISETKLDPDSKIFEDVWWGIRELYDHTTYQHIPSGHEAVPF